MPTAPTPLFRQGAFDADAMNGINNALSGIANGTFGFASFPSLDTSKIVSLLVNGAVPITTPLTPAVFQINKAGVLADTLAAPVTGTDDGKMIWIVSNTANPHTITATGLLQTGSASVNVGTYAAFAGAGMILMAFGAKWVVVSSTGVTFT